MSEPNLRDCAARGGDTISRRKGQINDEQLECVLCGHCVVWDLVDASFFGFAANCPHREPRKIETAQRQTVKEGFYQTCEGQDSGSGAESTP